ncbi:MAG TPA: RNA polymerase sigma factor [Gemmatimonadaceae bacterium]|nr:RNA polymerase sigma factor [Gemmatimonadaceae bacterium]
MNDAALVRRVLDGDSDAFTVLVDRYYDRYARYAVHMLGNREDAEEALQDAFLRAYRALPRYQERERFGAWLFRLLVNRCRTSAVRRRRRESVVVVSDDIASLGAVTRPAVEDAAWREELSRALESLPAEQREAFLLKHVEDLSYEEMAAITGVGISALKMRVKRACTRLRELLQEAQSVGTS